MEFNSNGLGFYPEENENPFTELSVRNMFRTAVWTVDWVEESP
jgi:hypothetical protein